MVARRIRRLAVAQTDDMNALRAIVHKNKNREPRPSPEADSPMPEHDERAVA
jgi:hypothetical protein